MINVIKLLSKKIMSGIIIFLIFAYITVFLCSIPSSFNIDFIDGKLTPSHKGIFIIKDTNEKFISLINLDLGTTGTDGRSLNYLVTNTMKRSISLLMGGLLIALILGILKGIFDSNRGIKKMQSLKILSTIIPISLPDIMIIALLQRLAVFLNTRGIEIFRVGGSGTLNHIFLPLIALSILPACYIARITSMSIDECYKQPFIDVALGKGCSNFRILWNHVMRKVIPSIIDSLPSITSIVLGNLLVVERVFGYPGLTKALVDFLTKYNRDGLIVSIILIGIIYFIMDTIFYMLRLIAFRTPEERII